MKHIKKLALVFILLALSSITPIYAKKIDTYVAKISYRFDARPPGVGKPDKDKDTATVEILNIPNEETVSTSVIVIAEVTGATQVMLSGSPMTKVGHGNRYYGAWTYADTPSIEVTALDSEGSIIASDSVSVNVVFSPQYTLYLEIDYLDDHKPSETVLNYLVDYWAGFGIELIYTPSDPVTDPTPSDGYISSSDFWYLEAIHNGVYYDDDQASDGVDDDGYGYDFEYMSQEKWILWGSWDDNQNVGGYTYVVIDGKDGLAGNYIFIADAMIDNWEASNDMEKDNGEVIVACHELGHSIGILLLRGRSEKYDSDIYSIMSTMHVENALYMEDAWYYSSNYWESKNLEYYR